MDPMNIHPQHKHVVMKMLEDLSHAATQTMTGSRLDYGQMSQQHGIKVEKWIILLITCMLQKTHGSCSKNWRVISKKLDAIFFFVSHCFQGHNVVMEKETLLLNLQISCIIEWKKKDPLY